MSEYSRPWPPPPQGRSTAGWTDTVLPDSAPEDTTPQTNTIRPIPGYITASPPRLPIPPPQIRRKAIPVRTNTTHTVATVSSLSRRNSGASDVSSVSSLSTLDESPRRTFYLREAEEGERWSQVVRAGPTEGTNYDTNSLGQQQYQPQDSTWHHAYSDNDTRGQRPIDGVEPVQGGYSGPSTFGGGGNGYINIAKNEAIYAQTGTVPQDFQLHANIRAGRAGTYFITDLETPEPTHKPYDGVEARNWKPVTTRPLFLIFLILITIALIVAVEMLLRISKRDHGLADSKGRHGDSNLFTFLHAYIPIIIAVCYTQLWWQVSIDIDRTEPFVRLSNPQGATGSSALFNTFNIFKAPLRSLMERNWIVFFSAIGYILAMLVVPPLQGTIFSIAYIHRGEDVSFSKTQPFSDGNRIVFPYDDYLPHLRLQTMLAYGKGVSTSPWMTADGFAVLPVRLGASGEMQSPRNELSEKWEFNSQVLKMELDCMEWTPKTIYKSLCEDNSGVGSNATAGGQCRSNTTTYVASYTPEVDGVVYQFYVGYQGEQSMVPYAQTVVDFSTVESKAGATADLYFGDFGAMLPPNAQNDFSEMNRIVRSTRNMTIPFNGIPQRAILTWNKVTLRNESSSGWQANAQPNYSLYTCKMSYLAAEMPVEYIISQVEIKGSKVTGIENREKLRIDHELFYERAKDISTTFNTSEFEWHLFSGTGNSKVFNTKNLQTVITGDMKPNDLPNTVTGGALRLMTNTLNHATLSEPGGLLREAKKFSSILFAGFVDLTVKAGLERGVETGLIKESGKRVIMQRRLVIIPGFARALQAVLSACTGLALAILVLSLFRKTGLQKDPSSLAASLAMLQSRQLTGFEGLGQCSSKELKKKLGERRFHLANGQLQSVDRPEISPDGHNRFLSRQEKADSTSPFQPVSCKKSQWRPFPLQFRYVLLFILFMVGLCIGVGVLWNLSDRPGAIGVVGDEEGGKWISLDFTWTTLPIFIVQAVKLNWSFLDATLRMLEPYAQLLGGMAPAAKSITVEYSSAIMGWVTIKSLRRGTFILAFITFISLLMELLTVSSSALFDRDLAHISRGLPAKQEWEINTQTLPGGDLIFDTLNRQAENNYFLSSIFSSAFNNTDARTPWTMDDYAFAPVTLMSQDWKSFGNGILGGNVTVTTIGVRASVDCKRIPIREGFVKRINFTVNQATAPGLFRGSTPLPHPDTKESLEAKFGQDFAWMFDQRQIMNPDDEARFHLNVNPFLDNSHKTLLNRVFSEQWQTNYTKNPHSWGYWNLPTAKNSTFPTMTILDELAVLPYFGVFWVEGEVMGYKLENARRQSSQDLFDYYHLYRNKPDVVLLTCTPRYESIKAEVTLQATTQRVLAFRPITEPKLIPNASFIEQPAKGAYDAQFCNTECRVSHHKLGFGVYFLAPLFNRDAIWNIQQGMELGTAAMQNGPSVEQIQSFGVVGNVAAYLTFLPYRGMRGRLVQELEKATEKAFRSLFVEFSTVKERSVSSGSFAEQRAGGKLFEDGKYNARNYVFTKRQQGEGNGAVGYERSTLTVLSQRVVVVEPAACLVLVILGTAIVGLVVAVVMRRGKAKLLPRSPDTVGSVLGWIYASGIDGEEVARESEDMGKRRFVMGWFTGRWDGEQHWGVEEVPLLERDELVDVPDDAGLR